MTKKRRKLLSVLFILLPMTVSLIVIFGAVKYWVIPRGSGVRVQKELDRYFEEIDIEAHANALFYDQRITVVGNNVQADQISPIREIAGNAEWFKLLDLRRTSISENDEKLLAKTFAPVVVVGPSWDESKRKTPRREIKRDGGSFGETTRCTGVKRRSTRRQKVPPIN